MQREEDRTEKKAIIIVFEGCIQKLKLRHRPHFIY